MSARALPDPRRSHGAWVVLCVSIAAGALVGGRVEFGLLAGSVFAGGFLALAAVLMGVRRRASQLVLGLALAASCAVLAHLLGADRGLLACAASAAVLGSVALLVGRRRGILAPPALVSGLAALVLAAPAAALAEGAGVRPASELFLALLAFVGWRSLRIARGLRTCGSWNAAELRATGLRESAYAALWALGLGLVLG